MAEIVDEQSAPPLRSVLGGLLSRAGEAEFAVARIRLAGLDLSSGELAGVRRCRVLVGRVDAGTFADADQLARRDPERRAGLERLATFLRAGRVSVRSAGREAWTPDFSVLSGLRGVSAESGDAVALVGAHYFARPHPPGGAAITCVLRERTVVDHLRRRFDILWSRSYDVLPVIRSTLAILLDPPNRGRDGE